VTLANGQTITIEVGKTTGTDHHRAERCVERSCAADQLDHRRERRQLRESGRRQNSGQTTVTDTVDTTNLSLSATGSVAEGGSITYTATLTNPLARQ
jgi:surface adhesion protein